MGGFCVIGGWVFGECFLGCRLLGFWWVWVFGCWVLSFGWLVFRWVGFGFWVGFMWVVFVF